MICHFHELRKPRAFNGNCWYCRKAELRLLAELEVENGWRKKRPEGLDIQSIGRICRLRRVARITRFEIPDPGRYGQSSSEDDSLMSFEAIGKELGITAQGAQQLCENGLKKLRELHPLACLKLQQLSTLRHECLPATIEELTK